MKRVGYLYDQLLNKELIDECITNACRYKKKTKVEVRFVLENRESIVNIIYHMFESESVEFSDYTVFYNYDPHSKKTRLIRKPALFPDQIIHWCMITVLRPVIEKGMYQYCSGSVPGRGSVWACNRLRKWIDEDRENTACVAQLDVSKFYDHINLEILMKMWNHRIKDKRMLKLIEKLVYTLDLGVPIGNYTSQWMANFYMQGIDHYIKEQLRIPYYIRYIDDMLLLASNTHDLHTAVRSIEKYLSENLKLKLKSSWQVYKLKDRGIDFLGLVFYEDCTKLRARNFLAFTRQARLLRRRIDNGDEVSLHESVSIMSRLALVKRCDHYNIIKKYLPYKYQLEFRKITSKMMKKNNKKLKEELLNEQEVLCTDQAEESGSGNHT